MLPKLTAIVLWALLSCLVAQARADDETPPPSSTPEADAVMRSCQILSARQAWGAMAQVNGAPKKVILISETPLQYWFASAVNFGVVPDVGILVLDGMSEDATKEYTEAAFSGWEIARHYWQAGELDLIMMHSRLYQFCMDSSSDLRTH